MDRHVSPVQYCADSAYNLLECEVSAEAIHTAGCELVGLVAAHGFSNIFYISPGPDAELAADATQLIANVVSFPLKLSARKRREEYHLICKRVMETVDAHSQAVARGPRLHRVVDTVEEVLLMLTQPPRELLQPQHLRWRTLDLPALTGLYNRLAADKYQSDVAFILVALLGVCIVRSVPLAHRAKQFAAWPVWTTLEGTVEQYILQVGQLFQMKLELATRGRGTVTPETVHWKAIADLMAHVAHYYTLPLPEDQE